METRRWTNPSQPQTLQIAVFLLYFRAAFPLIIGLLSGRFSTIGLLISVGLAAAGFGIANEKKWGYGLGVAMSFLPIVLRVFFDGLGGIIGRDVIGFMFEVALIALLLHPQSRDYQRIWFT